MKPRLFLVFLALQPARSLALGTLEFRGLLDSLKPRSLHVQGASWEAALPARLTLELGKWAEAQASWGWGGGSYAGEDGAGREARRGALPLGLSLRARTGVPDGTWALGMLGYSSAGDLALLRSFRTDSYLPETRTEERLLGGGRTLRMEASAESRMGRGRWRVTLWTQDEGSYPARGSAGRLDPGTEGGVKFQGRLGREREEKVALSVSTERTPSYREVGISTPRELFRSHTRNELKLEGWTNLGTRMGLGLILLESERTGVSLPGSRGPIPALWPAYRTGPALEAVLGLRHWMPGNANAFYSAGLFKNAGNDGAEDSDIHDQGWKGAFVAGEAEAALTATTGLGWKLSYTRTRDLGNSPDSAPGELNRVRSRVRVEFLLYRVI